MRTAKRITALLLSLILCAGLLPAAAYADTATETEESENVVIMEEETVSASELCEKDTCSVSEPSEEVSPEPEAAEEEIASEPEISEEEVASEPEVSEEEIASEPETSEEEIASEPETSEEEIVSVSEVSEEENITSEPEVSEEVSSEPETSEEEISPEAESDPEVEAAESADDEEGMTEFRTADGTDWTQYTLYNAKTGNSVAGNQAFLIPEDGVTLLMFFSSICWNCKSSTSSIAGTDWIRDDRVRVMMMESKYAGQEETADFLETYAGTAGSYINAFYGKDCSTLVWEYAYRLFNTNCITWPLLILLVEEDGAPVIRYASLGYQDISEISGHVEDLLEEIQTPDAPVLQSLSASVKGITLNWNEVSDAEKYKVYRKEAGGGWEGLKTTAKNSFTDTSAQMGVNYAYLVRAWSGSRWSDEGSSKSILFNPFTDVASSGKTFKYISWAYNNGIVTGTSDTAFSPSAACTRIQFVMMLWKMHGSPAAEGENPFSDISGTKTTGAILWALDKGIINSGNSFNPRSHITRSQIVMILWKLAGSPKASGTNPFSDIEDGTKLCKAAVWAYNNKITTGTSETAFSPDKDCTRQQLVTFLYKYNRIYGLI